MSPAKAPSTTRLYRVECAKWRTVTFSLSTTTVRNAKRGNKAAQNSIVARYKEKSDTDTAVRINWSSLTLTLIESKDHLDTKEETE